MLCPCSLNPSLSGKDFLHGVLKNFFCLPLHFFKHLPAVAQAACLHFFKQVYSAVLFQSSCATV